MTKWVIKRGAEILATVSGAMLETTWPGSPNPSLRVLKGTDGRVLGTLYLASNLTVEAGEDDALVPNKSLPSATLPSDS